MHNAYLLIGGNEGDRFAHLEQARANIEHICGHLVRSSALYSTAAWGNEAQPEFLNQALLLKTEMTPPSLLRHLLSIETDMGRRRTVKYGPRTIDIDILFYDHAVVDADGLRIPHPLMADRRFVLAPLAELAPDFLHPELKKTVSALLAACTDPLPVKKI